MSDTESKIYPAHHNEAMGGDLSRQMTLQISPEAYERLFFQPTPARGDLAKRLGNPTLVGLLGFLIPYQSTIFCLLKFQGATTASLVADSGAFCFLGGIAMVIAGICEFILGNTFPFAVFIVYGAHWANLGYSNSPAVNLASAYGTDGAGALTRTFNAGGGFYNVTMLLVTLVFFFGSIRTNIPFVITFISIILLFGFLAAADFHLGAYGLAGAERAGYLAYCAGAVGFPAALCGWYLAIITACAATGVPCPLPVFDLSTKVFPHSKAAENEAAGAGGGAVARPHEEV